MPFKTYGKIRTNVDELGCEYLTLTAHKINGPKGAGALYWRGNTKWNPLVYGKLPGAKATGGDGRHSPDHWSGSSSGLGTGSNGTRTAQALGTSKTTPEGTEEDLPDIRVNGASPERQLPGIMEVTFPGKEGIRILAGLDCYEISVSIGSACTADRIEPSHVLLGMGLSEKDALSSIRISMGTTTKPGDVRYFLVALKESSKRRPCRLLVPRSSAPHRRADLL